MLPGFLRRKASNLTVAINTPSVETVVEPEPEPSKEMVPYNNPFNREDIRSVQVWYRKFWSTDTEFTASGSIEFKQGSTSGKQEFNGPTIEDILEQMAKFVKSL